ncbi:hypothetical protein BB559_002109 [Furculomyces boomerangus]|uniref:Ribosomal protein S6 n=2 Tax=Harpellales TaxID=61421 RepID=A0A2T9YY07_9FUNG|nr:hypothetical protein BB559_002109 [Furculomyces boomerangus]PWA02252.1 hypothetical protein BB558_001614 [Smittium angustum]
MPLYEVVNISKTKLHTRVFADLLKISAKTILDNGGAVKGFVPLCFDRKLPYRMRKNKEWHTDGSYWIMHFYSNPAVANLFINQLKSDPRIIRTNMVKIGEKLDDFIELQSTLRRV